MTGGSYPAAAWGAYMTEAMKGQPVLKFNEPDLKPFGKAEAIKMTKAAGGSAKKAAVPTTTVPPPVAEADSTATG